MKRRELSIFAVLLLAGILLYIGLSSVMGLPLFGKYHNNSFIKPEVTGKEDYPLPQFSILLSDSTTYVNIGALNSGKPTVLFYFSPYCPYCQAEVREILQNIDRLKDLQFYLLTPFSFREMKEFHESFELGKYQNIRTGVDFKFFFGPYFKAGGVPFLAIYGKDNKMKGAFIGILSSEQLIAFSRK